MKITFKLNSAGTSHDRCNAIQVCGCENIFDYWGCGVFQDNNGNPKKDIQLLFNKETKIGGTKHLKLGLSELCHKCFYPKKKCMCKDLRIKTIDELTLEYLIKEERK